MEITALSLNNAVAAPVSLVVDLPRLANVLISFSVSSIAFILLKFFPKYHQCRWGNYQ